MLTARLIDLHKYYDLGSVVVKALRGVSLDIPEGDFLAIMGSSGSGKSTLLNLLGALDRPTSGQYFLREQDVAQLDDDELSAIRNGLIGFIFQSFNLIAQYSVLENIQVPLHYRPGYPPLSDEDVARSMGMSARSLQRRMQDEGTTYQAFVQEVRADLAASYLAEGQMPLGEIAFVLGYSEPSAFHRSFKRSRGVTPLKFRAQARTVA